MSQNQYSQYAFKTLQNKAEFYFDEMQNQKKSEHAPIDAQRANEVLWGDKPVHAQQATARSAQAAAPAAEAREKAPTVLAPAPVQHAEGSAAAKGTLASQYAGERNAAGRELGVVHLKDQIQKQDESIKQLKAGIKSMTEQIVLITGLLQNLQNDAHEKIESLTTLEKEQKALRQRLAELEGDSRASQ